MVGMRDVAKAAGVSLSTVSLVVNNTGYVSADMRAKIESAMRQLNYIPSWPATSTGTAPTPSA